MLRTVLHATTSFSASKASTICVVDTRLLATAHGQNPSPSALPARALPGEGIYQVEYR